MPDLRRAAESQGRRARARGSGARGSPSAAGAASGPSSTTRRRQELEAALETHEKAHPVEIITRYTDGSALTDSKGKPVPEAPRVDELVLEGDPRERESA